MKTNELIDRLVREPPPRLSFRAGIALAMALGLSFTAVPFFMAVGIRADLSQAMGSIRVLFKFVVALALAISAAGAVLRSGDPIGNLKPWGWALGAVPALLIFAVAIELTVIPEGVWLHRLIGHRARFCLTTIPLLSIGPLACLVIALRQGAPARPGLAGAIAGLAASGIAVTFYASNCTDDSPLFVATWYTLAILIITATGFLIGKRFLTW